MGVWPICIEPCLVSLVLPDRERNPMDNNVDFGFRCMFRLISLEMLHCQQTVQMSFGTVDNDQNLIVSKAYTVAVNILHQVHLPPNNLRA